MTEAKLDDRTYDLLFAVRRSVRYHIHRRRFFESWNTFTITVTVFGGSATFAAVISKLDLGAAVLIAPALVTLLAAIDLAVGTGKRGNEHGDLARQFISLEQEFSHGNDLTDVEHERLLRRRLEIEASEPPDFRLLDAMCHFELLRAKGDEDKHPHVPWYRRLIMHFFSQAMFARGLTKNADPA